MDQAAVVESCRPPAISSDLDHRSGRRLAYLDGWRGLCILAVLLGHFLPFHSLEFGDLGVEMFFVLSGRLMAEILFVQKFPLHIFYIRRFSRVWPGLAVYILFCAAAFSAPGYMHVRPIDIAAALLFLSNYRIEFFQQSQVLDHTWSLSVEEHSYMALGLVAAWLRDKSSALICSIIMALALAMMFNGILQTYMFPTHDLMLDVPAMHWHEYFNVYWRSDIRAASVFLPVFIYLRLHTRGSCALPKEVLIAVALCGSLSFLTVLPETFRLTIGTTCLAISVCALDAATNPFRSILSHRVLVMFGSWSYSIYIWQQFFYKLFQAMRASGTLSAFEGGMLRPLFVIGACGAGIFSYNLVEKPARRYINKHWARPAI